MSDFPMLQLCKKLGSASVDDAKLKHSLAVNGLEGIKNGPVRVRHRAGYWGKGWFPCCDTLFIYNTGQPCDQGREQHNQQDGNGLAKDKLHHAPVNIRQTPFGDTPLDKVAG